jgi:hypothetical protein
MNRLKRIFAFLASIYFAIALIALAAVTVIVGTLLESRTGSHLYAAQWTYHHPGFQLLLACFFINILFSALRRWPFKTKHIPFLMTHLGLLMIIAGTMVKNRHGLQGNLFVWEGSGNDRLFIPHTYALTLEKKGDHPFETICDTIPLSTLSRSVYYSRLFPSLKCKVVGSAPHVKEKFETWVKQDKSYLYGLPALPIQKWKEGDPLPPFIYSSIYGQREERCGLLCLRVDHIEAALKEIYPLQLTMHISSDDPLAPATEIPLSKVLQEGLDNDRGKVSVRLDLIQLNEPEQDLKSALIISSPGRELRLPLTGPDALMVHSHPYRWMPATEKIDLKRASNLLCIIEDKEENVWLVALDKFGRISQKPFHSDKHQVMTAYDQGFGGYTVQAQLLAPSFPSGRAELELAKKERLQEQLRQAMVNPPPLSPPLELFAKAAAQAETDFTELLIEFLYEWHNAPDVLFHSPRTLSPRIEQTLLQINWKELPRETLQAVLWTNSFIKQIQAAVERGSDLENELRRTKWPFVDELKSEKFERTLPTLLSRQMASIASSLPPLPLPEVLTVNEHAALLSAYLKIFEIDYPSLIANESAKEDELWEELESYWKGHHLDDDPIISYLTLESPLTNSLKSAEPPERLEDYIPGIVVNFTQGGKKQRLALAYDSTTAGIKWPVLGEYKIGFQPEIREIPYRIRLRQARSITYPNSSQVYSYESDILITEKGKEPIEQTLSMNRVYETWDGYRFYLAGIGAAPNQELKRIQLIVNYDPAKYFLTYPGAFLVFFGASLLFWWRPYTKQT